MRPLLPVIIVALTVLAACSKPDTYTLYRNGTMNDTLRMHVATFDVREPREPNHDACERVRELFQVQPGVTARYWCEKGAFRARPAK